MIISDMDGTLLNEHHLIGDYTRDVLQRVHGAGRQLVLATGRHEVEVQAIREHAGFPAYMVTSNGARIADDNNKVIYRQDLPVDVVAGLVGKMVDCEQTSVHIYTDEGWFYNRIDGPLASFDGASPLSRFRFTKEDFPVQGVAKVFMCSENVEALHARAEEIASEFAGQVNVTTSFPWCVEIMAADVSKGRAIAYLSELLNRPLTQAIAFGDGMNDADMLSVAGKGLVMGNADDRLKTALPNHQIIGLNTDEAVARYLEQHILQQDAAV